MGLRSPLLALWNTLPLKPNLLPSAHSHFGNNLTLYHLFNVMFRLHTFTVIRLLSSQCYMTCCLAIGSLAVSKLSSVTKAHKETQKITSERQIISGANLKFDKNKYGLLWFVLLWKPRHGRLLEGQQNTQIAQRPGSNPKEKKAYARISQHLSS